MDFHQKLNFINIQVIYIYIYIYICMYVLLDSVHYSTGNFYIQLFFQLLVVNEL